VPLNSLLEAKDFFNKNNYKIETQIFKNCEHHIPTQGSSLGLQFIKKHLL
jgi:phospholipase/carboxylesterase